MRLELGKRRSEGGREEAKEREGQRAWTLLNVQACRPKQSKSAFFAPEVYRSPTRETRSCSPRQTRREMSDQTVLEELEMSRRISSFPPPRLDQAAPSSPHPIQRASIQPDQHLEILSISSSVVFPSQKEEDRTDEKGEEEREGSLDLLFSQRCSFPQRFLKQTVQRPIPTPLARRILSSNATHLRTSHYQKKGKRKVSSR